MPTKAAEKRVFTPPKKPPSKFHWRRGGIEAIEKTLSGFREKPEELPKQRDFIRNSLERIRLTHPSPAQRILVDRLVELTEKPDFGLRELDEILRLTCYLKFDL